MTLNYFFAYLSLIFLATIIPGPNMLLALNHGANYGIKKTVYSGFGNLVGNLLMALISILGLGIILLKSGILFNIIKWMGVLYLIYLGLKMILLPVDTEDVSNIQTKQRADKSRWRLFFDGFCTAVSNPKGIVFFTALFPQFIHMNSSSWSEFVIVFFTMGAVVFGCYVLYGLFGLKLNKLFHRKSFRNIFNQITGFLMIGIGLTIAFSK